jgi:hypothetical protein
MHTGYVLIEQATLSRSFMQQHTAQSDAGGESRRRSDS